MYAQSNTLLLADVFNNFWNTCLEIYELNPARFVTEPGLPRPAALNDQMKLKLLTDTDMLLMIEKGIRGGICNTIHWYVKANNK